MNRRSFVHGSLATAVAASLPARGVFDAVTGAGASVTLERAAVQELGESLRGNLLLSGHPAYDDARRVPHMRGFYTNDVIDETSA